MLGWIFNLQGNLIEHDGILGEVVREAEAVDIARPVVSMPCFLCCEVRLWLKNIDISCL